MLDSELEHVDLSAPIPKNILRDQLLEIELLHEESGRFITKKVPSDLSVVKLKSIIRVLFGVPPTAQHLLATNKKVLLHQVLFPSAYRSLSPGSATFWRTTFAPLDIIACKLAIVFISNRRARRMPPVNRTRKHLQFFFFCFELDVVLLLLILCCGMRKFPLGISN